jgi:hypothetical protein
MTDGALHPGGRTLKPLKSGLFASISTSEASEPNAARSSRMPM